MRIRALYRLPARKEILVIASFPYTDQNSPKLSELRKLRIESLEHTLKNKHCMRNNQDQQWTIRIIPEDDFLLSLSSQENIMQVTTNQPFRNSEDMELLAINLLKTPRSSTDLSYNTPKILSKVLDEDIIEVFI